MPAKFSRAAPFSRRGAVRLADLLAQPRIVQLRQPGAANCLLVSAVDVGVAPARPAPRSPPRHAEARGRGRDTLASGRGGGCAAVGRAGEVHPRGCRRFPGRGRADRKRQGAARFRAVTQAEYGTSRPRRSPDLTGTHGLRRPLHAPRQPTRAGFQNVTARLNGSSSARRAGLRTSALTGTAVSTALGIQPREFLCHCSERQPGVGGAASRRLIAPRGEFGSSTRSARA